MVISAYQVCTKPTNLQGITAYHQQETAFHRQRRSNTNPRYNFRHDLIKFIKLQQPRGTRILLLGDFNQHINTPNCAVHSTANQCNLIDVWKRCHNTIPEPNTYLRGKTRINYVLVSPVIVNAVQSIGYEPFHHMAATDHHGIFMDLDTK
jgi:exonuclease III